MNRRYLLLGIPILALAFVFALVLVVSPQPAQAAGFEPICLETALQEDDPLPYTVFLPYQYTPCGAPVVEIPFYTDWAFSPHNDEEAEAFRHWDDEENPPGEISTSCAKCHSTPGYEDFLGADGSEAGVVNEPALVGSTIECVACHNDVTLTKTSVTFPSGVTIEHLGDESRCMECHQGRSSKFTVDDKIEDAGMTEDVDTVSENLSFSNIHYYAAAATQYGGLVLGGYQYDGMAYDVNFRHVESYDQCYECHDMHTLELKLNECATCHEGVTTTEDLKDIRMAGSLADYDGDGDMTEGIWYEIKGLEEKLYTAIQEYGVEVSGTPIVYDSHSYPYWFDDQGERYASWTARLTKAVYNYQVSMKDPGEHGHNGKYIIQLLHDSTDDLNEAITNKVDMSTAMRIDPGHFAGSEEAWRHWDEDEYEVSGSCSKCHSAEGIPFLLEEGVSITQEASNGMECHTCHNVSEFPARYVFEDATFPNGAEVSLEKDGNFDSNLCIQCHQGRSTGAQLDDDSEGIGDDEVASSVKFHNIHYFAAGATLFGNVTNGIYEYEGETYVGQNMHPFGSSSFGTCTDCHNSHVLEVEYQACNTCHAPINSPDDLKNIRGGPAVTTPDYDGDGDTDEGVYYELMGMADAVYAGIQTYASAHPDTDAICYDSHSYPYWFKDTNENGVCDDGEANYDNRYSTWTPRLARAAYNYQYALKDPGGFAHNNKYVIQALYDNLADMESSDYADGLTDGKNRPE